MKIAAIQFPLQEGQEAAAFLTKVQTYISEAAQAGAKLVVFPELISTELVDWHSRTPHAEQLRAIATNFTPQYIEFLRNEATTRHISILGGSTPREVSGEIRNTAILALADGQIVLQDKIFLTPDEQLWGWQPGTELRVFKAPWGKTVITTCFDCEYPILSQGLVQPSPELWLVPSWTSTVFGLNRVGWTAHARAVEQFAYIVRTGTVPGQGATQAHQGQASIIGPQDQGFSPVPITGQLNQPQIVYGDLDFEILRDGRQRSGYFPGKEQLKRTSPINVTEDP